MIILPCHAGSRLRLSGISLHGILLLKQQSKNTVSVRQATWEIPAQKLAGMTREEHAG